MDSIYRSPSGKVADVDEERFVQALEEQFPAINNSVVQSYKQFHNSQESPQSTISYENLKKPHEYSKIHAPKNPENDDVYSMFSAFILMLFGLISYLVTYFTNIVMFVFNSFYIFGKGKDAQAISLALEQMDNANNYTEWETAAKQFDTLKGRDKWKAKKESSLYDFKMIEHWYDTLRNLEQTKDADSLMLALRSGQLRNLGGIAHTKLFDYTTTGTKKLIEDYTEEVVKQLNYICDSEFEDLTLIKKFDFFYELRQTFGRSGLLLSGGSTLGMYHFGMIKALFEEGLLPRVISGSSVGSIIASIVCTLTDEELPKAFFPGFADLNAFEVRDAKGSMRRKLFRLIKKGYLMEMNTLEECVRRNIGDITFKEAYDKTKRILNITVASSDTFEFPRLLNYITAPNVLIWSASCASCALPLLYEPVSLMAKDLHGNISPYHTSGQKFIDGSVGADLPMLRLAELFNVNHFIVSQVNPHVAPFLYIVESRRGNSLASAALYLMKSELKHRVTQLAELGLIPRSFSRVLQPIITQKYRGDITVVPKIPFSHFCQLVSNPNEDFIQACITEGRKNTWPKLSMIKYHCMIEFTLERCFTELGRKLYQSQKTPIPRSISQNLRYYNNGKN